MMRRWRVFLILLVLGMPLVHAQAGSESATPALAEDVTGIRQALDRLVDLLETVQHNQRVELMLKRIELRERRLAPLEKRLATAQLDVEGIQGELAHLTVMKDRQDRELDEISLEREADDGDRRMLQEIELMQTSMEARLEEAEARVRRFEDELADGREEIEILDELLLEMLDTD